ncbi:hypothetical protein DPMN_007475 [Dreissena polymorpha]|uniref:Uncharacterized protein n=1 Tax=Dreissena polymorpha TaxID=45954 RepID=A0A9D4RW31_DREPO|nr:hypothetical protein DPMN_007475 [Dreissena polymorpha]
MNSFHVDILLEDMWRQGEEMRRPVGEYVTSSCRWQHLVDGRRRLPIEEVIVVREIC